MANHSQACQVQVFGLINDDDFQRARCCAEDLYKQSPDVFVQPVTIGMVEFDWVDFIEEKKRKLEGETWVFEDKAITFVNGDLIGGPESFIDWAEENHGYEDYRPMALYETLAQAAYKTHLNSQKHDFAFMNISIDGEDVGKLVFELFSDIVPKTCENFLALCSGEKVNEDDEYKLHYKDRIFHRIVPNGWIQGGDIFHGRGNGGESIYGPVFEDENFAVPHNRRGTLGMANHGRHSNGSQFYITLQPTEWMDRKYVAFGRVIEGTETLKKMAGLDTINQRPNKEVKVEDCGIIKYEF